MKEFLSRVNISGFDVDTYFSNHASNISQLPNLAVAFSGGGWRALMNGAGAMTAFDNRTADSTTSNHLGGIVQASTYLAGLSGGSWLVSSIYMNNFSTVPALQYSNDVWEFQNSIIEGPPSDGIQLLSTVGYWESVYDQVDGKEDAGYETTITDYWGRTLSYQLINATSGGPAYTWSSIALDEDFQNGKQPMPVIIADERAPGETLIPGNTTIFEMNPFEFGTWDPTVYGFIPLKYLGTNFTSGSVVNTSSCVVGFDNAGYLFGTSSSLFNQLVLEAITTNSSLPSFLTSAIQSIAEDIGSSNEDIAEYKPNPFYRYALDTNPAANSSSLTLVDGGEDLENIPLHPLIQPVRGVDIILAIDSSADTDTNWPNGTSLVATYERSTNANGTTNLSNGTSFPSIPDVNTFVNLGLNSRPTFFGCNASNTTNPSSPPPIIVYLPNAPYTTNSNVSTFTLSYSETKRDAIIQNGYNVATMANGSLASNWTTCLACAMMSRSWYRTSTDIPTICQECFDSYCWDGTLNATTPALYEPELKVDDTNSSSNSSSSSSNKNSAIRNELAVSISNLVFGVLGFGALFLVL
ncbi:putative lysophospholipase plb1 [Phaeomoniella chlamydospora]|uniref:Lysophospholipase n=1 Tax=Phaeomoniella chlamydospora TaxID=158046 RepID=A0A0G2GRS1_PHACM|nr:putative lysophospholipase plb1 [Phaeomoniella chlamydospora]